MSSSSGQPLLDGFVSRLLGARLAGAAIEDVPRCGRVSGVVLFVDIVDSTSMTDRLAASGPDGAERLGGLLNDYFREVIDIVTAHGGDVIRINGDAVIALWRDDGPSAAAHLQAAHAAIALRDIRHVWPVDPPQPLRHRLTSVAGTFNAVILSASGKRSFLVFAGERLRTIEAISHSGQPGEIVLDGTMARLLAPCAVLRPIVEPGAAAHGATRLDRLEEGRALPPVLSPPKAVTPTPPAADAFVPRIVIERGNSGLSGWLAEFRVLTMVYARLGGSDVPDAAAAERLQTIFEVVANAVDAMGVELFELIANENGIIAQIACGLPSFGVESNATRAVEIARRICEEVAAVGVPCPVGVSTGRAFCGDVGTTIRREYVLTGPVMNYGARLMQAAGSNVICDAETVRETNTRFTFSAGEEIFVRGRRQPLTVHRLIEARASPTLRVRYATGLHGRDSELTQLAARLELLCGGVGGLVTVEGEPGAGKSRLLAEFGEAARRRGCAIIETSTHAIEQTTAYFAFRPVLRHLLEQSGHQNDTPLSVLRQRLADALAGTDLMPRAALIEDILPLGIEDPGLAAQIRGAARRAGIDDIVVALAARRAAERPLVILLDDLHWIDALSANLLLAATRRLPQIMVVAASRPHGAAGAQYGLRVLDRAVLRIALWRLDPASTSRMICELLRVPAIPRRLAEFVHEQSEGLPIHAEHLALSLLENGLIEVVDGRSRVIATDLGTASVPFKLRDIIVSRIDGLGQADQLAVKVASAIGRVFEIDALRAIYPMRTDVGSLAASACRLVDAGILAPVAGHSGPAYAFRHVIIQEATYDLLSFAQRRPLHRHVAELIERSHAGALEPHFAELAHHWEHAVDIDKALEYRLLAAGLAIRGYANDDALMHADRAERLATRRHLALSVAQRAQLAYIRGEAFHALSRFPEAKKHFTECLGLSGIKLPTTPTRMMLSVLGQIARQGLHRFGLTRNPRGEARQERTRLSAHLHTRFAEHAYFMSNALALVHGTLTALNQAESVGSVSEIIEGYGGLAIGLGTAGRHAAARYYRDRSIAVAEGAGGLSDQGFAQLLATVYSFQAGHWDAAHAHATQGSAICKRLGDHFRHQSCRVIDCYTAIATGDYGYAAAGFGAFGPQAEVIENAPVRAWVLAGLSILDMVQGRPPARTLAWMDAARDETLHRAEQLLCDGLEAAARLRAGDTQGGERVAVRALDSMRGSVCTMGIALFSVHAVAEVHLVLAERAVRLGAPHDVLLTRAREACEALRRYAAQTLICRPRAQLLAGRLALLEGRRRHAAARFRRALVEAERLGMPLDQAMCHLALASAQAEGAAPQTHSERGVALLRGLGADPWRYQGMAYDRFASGGLGSSDTVAA